MVYQQMRSFLGKQYRALRYHHGAYLKRRVLCRIGFAPKLRDTKTVITVLTYKRPRILRRTLESLYEVNDKQIRHWPIIVLIQGQRPGETAEAEQVTEDVRQRFSVPLQVDLPGKNLGVAAGYTRLMNLALEHDPDFILHIEDDWESNEPFTDHLYGCYELFKKCPRLGCIRLRNVDYKYIRDHGELTGVRWRVGLYQVPSGDNTFFWLGNLEFQFQPTITRAAIIRRLLPVLNERDARWKYQKMGWLTAQLHARCFLHQTLERVDGWKR